MLRFSRRNMRIVTLTLNPAFDLHCSVENFQPFCENLADVTDSDAGGKGVNIAKALTANGIEQTAVVVLGEDNLADFEAALQKDGIRYLAVPVPGRIRENITLHTRNADETRISFRGFSAGRAVLERVEKCLTDLTAGDVVTLTGRNPDGMEIGDVKAFCRRLIARGVRMVVDSRSFSLADLLEVKPWLIKPNQEEISGYRNREIRTVEDAKSAAEELHEAGIENVMISLGSNGAVLASPDGTFFVSAPKLKTLSTVGAGDASIAGFLAAAKEGKASLDRLRLAVAYGSAACLCSGTKPPLKKNVEALFLAICKE